MMHFMDMIGFDFSFWVNPNYAKKEDVVIIEKNELISDNSIVVLEEDQYEVI